MPDIPYGRDYDEDGAVVPRLDERPLYPPPAAPYDVARKLYVKHQENRTRTLVCWRAGWMKWDGTHWSEMDSAELRSGILRHLGRRRLRARNQGWRRTTAVESRHAQVANIMDAMAGIGHLTKEIDPPSWIGPHSAAETPAAQMISCRNGLLDLTQRQIRDHTPTLFNVVSVPFAYDPDAARPTAWLEFLASVWPDDPGSVALLQEYVGYVLCGRTDMQKMLLLIGPTRSGKGTIARMLTELVGRGHVAGPTLASMGTNFGLSPLLGKPLAIISDARLGNAPTHTVVERLLSITGEDMLTVDRKFRDPWSGKLSTRFVVLSNELPRFKDSSGAIANRMLILQMTKSFLGNEDRTLDDRLAIELPGILAWALDGLDRLTNKGKFTVPESSRDAAHLMMDLASPMSAFVRERCKRDPAESVLADYLYDVWKVWAEDNGHRPSAKSTFGRDLRAVVPELKVSQPTISGSRLRRYDGIGVRSSLLNADVPVHPVQTEACTGCGTESTAANPLVNGRCTGCTGESAFKAKHSGSTCPGCGHPVPPGHVQCQPCYQKRQSA